METPGPLFIVLNGPLGVGKSSLGEALCEHLCEIYGDVVGHTVHLDGDALIAASPSVSEDERGRERLHGAIELLAGHHHNYGARYFVISHVWFRREDLDDLRMRLTRIEPRATVRLFRLCLDPAENLRRIERRARSRIIDELDFERRTVREERALLDGREDLGELLEVGGSLASAVTTLLGSLEKTR